MTVDTVLMRALVKSCEALIMEFPPGRPLLTAEISAGSMNTMESALKDVIASLRNDDSSEK